MTKDQLRKRTKEFALRAIKLVDALPRKPSGDVLGKQLLRSATSVGANYRSACRGRSEAEFVAKLGIVIEEADEAEYWMELISDGGLMKASRVAPLQKEASELVAIFTASVRTTRRKTSKR
ncbi:MAG: four helix bundle protein [Verrucomicrobiaceae bacterium]|nr:four helix bundle protein [Verrucomicrobiaceae bacterium]